MLVQTLSNIVTLNDGLGTQLWDLYTITLSDDQNILVLVAIAHHYLETHMI